jgi:transglutaminase-like putative cysteine protease
MNLPTTRNIALATTKYCTAIFLYLFFSLSAMAQSSDEENPNISLQEVKREFVVIAGNSEHPVLIKEESNLTYYCKEYRATVQVAEFYNDMETLDDVDILVDGSKKHGIIPKKEFYESDGIFYSDARVCYFNLPLKNQGSVSTVRFKKTYLDPKYFASIHFLQPQPVTKGEVVIRVPSWMKLDIKEYNFGQYGIQKQVSQQGSETVYRFVMENLPALKREPFSPGFTHYSPHILIMTRYAETQQGRQNYFNTLNDQYAWYHQLIMDARNDEPFVKEKAQEITKGLSADADKVRHIFQWVQDNIRYIAFEDGIAGFRPEKGSEVMRKKYGDCKGMANLLVEMLQSIGLDARHCWIGTRHLVYDYSTPSLAVDNHMIAVWMNNKKPVYLDATEKYIGIDELAERIQGRQTLIEDNANYILDRVPVREPGQNTLFEKRSLSIEGNNLKGHVIQSWKGENRVALLEGINSIKQENQNIVLKNYLSRGKNNFEISNLRINNLTDYNNELSVEYDLNWKNVLAAFNNEAYLELDNRRKFEDLKIDTAKRKLPYWFQFKDHIVFETTLRIPADKKVTGIPASLKIERPGYRFSGSYTVNDTALVYRCEIALLNTVLGTGEFRQWNEDVLQLKDFYNQQIVLTTRK